MTPTEYLETVPKLEIPRVIKLHEGELALLTRHKDGNSQFGGREYFILTSWLVYKINGVEVSIPPGLVTDRATVELYALRSLLNKLGLWCTVKCPAVLHDWLPSERYSDEIFLAALEWEWRNLTGHDARRARRQALVMYDTLKFTFPLRGVLAKRPPASVMEAAKDYCERNHTDFEPYTTHDQDHHEKD